MPNGSGDTDVPSAPESKLTVFWDDRCLAHRPPDGAYTLPESELLAVAEPHPDRPERIRNIRRIVERALGDRTTFEDVTAATRAQLERVHDAGYLDELRDYGTPEDERITATTVATEETYDAARAAAGAAVGAAEVALRSGVEEIPYALGRPSGHHAQSDRADGFCFLNNVAVAAEHAIATGRAERVAIVDWDVHHGNGTQEIFEDRDDVLFVSLHNDHGSWDPVAHPQTGSTDEVGRGDGEGYNLNVPLPTGTGDEGYAYAFDRIVEPVVAEFDPDLLLISAGQDAGAIDPLGRNLVTKTGYEELGRRARALAEADADGHLAVIQEGGYQLTHLAFATLGVLEGALEADLSFDDADIDLSADPFERYPENRDLAVEWIETAVETHGRYWNLD